MHAPPSQSKIVLVQATGGITTPLDTIKIRLQVMGHQENRPSAKKVVKDPIAEDGWKGFYRGLGPRFFSKSAWGTTMILTYEYLKVYVCSRRLEKASLLLFLGFSPWTNSNRRIKIRFNFSVSFSHSGWEKCSCVLTIGPLFQL